MDGGRKTSFSFRLDAGQQDRLARELREGNYRPAQVAYTRIAADRPDCRIALYESGKCVVQGRGAQDWVSFVLEPNVLGALVTGYEEVLRPADHAPHMGIDESGKGDFLGPMVIAAAYADADLVRELRRLDVRDSKTISSDRRAEEMAAAIRRLLGHRFALVTIGPRAYNRLYASMGSVNKLLAWGHARAIENLLERVPGCPRAVADQFGPERQIRQALLRKGRAIELVQRHRAESDPAVAAASVLARAGFLAALRRVGEQYGVAAPKGASAAVRAAAVEIGRRHGPAALLDAAKCHFRTLDAVLAELGATRAALGPEGQAVSKAARPGRAAAPARAPEAEDPA